MFESIINNSINKWRAILLSTFILYFKHYLHNYKNMLKYIYILKVNTWLNYFLAVKKEVIDMDKSTTAIVFYKNKELIVDYLNNDMYLKKYKDIYNKLEPMIGESFQVFE